jgi:cytochrome c oxidase assembly protein subunit 15
MSPVAASTLQLQSLAAVRLWLWLLTTLVFAMVVVGGATRLTGSGLSITEWSPILGAIPPLTDQAWQDAFSKYQAIPQYKILNSGMSLDEFKFIFWWEWSHRQLGRAIGLVMGFGIIGFLLSGHLRGKLALQIIGIDVLGGLQGTIGWIMVASGLKEGMTAVAPIKLALHLTTAAIIFTLLVSLVTSLNPKPRERAATGTKAGASILLLLVLVQIALGALVAGSKAGFIWNTWPLMDGALFPPADALFNVAPWIENFVDNTLLVQFNHRITAYLVFVYAIFHAWRVSQVMPRSSASKRAYVIIGLIFVQMIIGILTLLYVVPLHLALTHQAFAFIVLGMAAAHRAALGRG